MTRARAAQLVWVIAVPNESATMGVSRGFLQEVKPTEF